MLTLTDDQREAIQYGIAQIQSHRKLAVVNENSFAKWLTSKNPNYAEYARNQCEEARRDIVDADRRIKALQDLLSD